MLLSPYYLLSLASGAKSFRDNPFIGSYKLNSLGLHVSRVSIAEKLARYKRKQLSSQLEAKHLREFERNGFVVIQNALPKSDFTNMVQQLEQTSFEAHEMKQGGTVTRFISLTPSHFKQHPHLASLVNSNLFRGLFHYGACSNGDPYVALHTVFSPGPESGDPQTVLHTDTFHATAKGWFFLKDVELDDGPFSYVPGSHYATPGRLEWEQNQSLSAFSSDNPYHARGSFRATPDEIHAMGYDDAVPLAVPANTLVIADTHGFHARMPSKRPAVRFGVYGSLRRNPYLPWTGGDVMSLPGLRGRRAQIQDILRDTQSWLTGKPDGQPSVGFVRPTEAARR